MRKFLLSLPIFFLCACTGSSTASSGSVKTISGVVSAGPLNSATVTAYEMKADGTQGTQLGVTTSDAKGTYKLAMTSSSNPIMIVVSGGSYVEEASGSTISMGKAQFRTLLPAVTDGQKVGVTPITEIATQSALANISYNSSVSISAIIKNSNSKVATAMGLTDITLPPADPTLAAAQASSTAAAQYAVVLAAISQLAKTAATSNSTAVTMLDIMQALSTSFT